MTVPGTNLRSLRQVDLVIFRAILCFIISLDFIVVDLHSPALAIASHQYVKAAVPSGFLHAVLIMEVLAVEAVHHSCVSFSFHCLLLHHFVESLFLRVLHPHVCGSHQVLVAGLPMAYSNACF